MTRFIPQRRATFLSLLMLLTLLSAASTATTTNWSGPSEVKVPGGGGNVTVEGFSIPVGETVTDAWLEVSEDGLTDLGSGRVWRADAPGQLNFSWGQWDGTTANFFDGSLSLDANHSVGRINDFETLTRTLQSWQMGGTPGIWEVDDMVGLPGVVNGSGRESSGGLIPIGGVNGRYIVATLADQALPNGVHTWLESPDFTLPTVINKLNLSFEHWQHMYTPSLANGDADGAWLEMSLDSGQNWRYMTPDGGYNNRINAAAPAPPGSGGANFEVWASPDATRWQTANFNLDNEPGILNATHARFRFVVWTDANSTIQRPGWFLDKVNLSNVGADPGTWFHGNLTDEYASSAESFLLLEVDLSNASGPIMLNYATDFDMEGDIYDNFRWDWATWNSSNWTSFSAAMPGNGVLIGGQVYVDDSRGWKRLMHPLPQSLAGNSTVYLRVYVKTDGFPGSGYGGSAIDPPEGVFIDDVEVISGLPGNETVHLSLNFTDPNNGGVTHARIGFGIDEWQHLTDRGVDGPTYILDSFEDSPLLPEGWTIDTMRGDGWEFRGHNSSWSYGPDAPATGSNYAGITFSREYEANTWTHLTSPPLDIPIGSHARISFDSFICAEVDWDGGVLMISDDGGRSWSHYGANVPDFYDTYQSINPFSDIHQMWAFDGSNAKPTCQGARGTPNINKSWVTKQVDVSQYGGQAIQLRFSFFTDDLMVADGWYLDNVGLYVDWFEEHGTWLSDPIYPEDLLGLDALEVDADVPNGTWVRVTVLGEMNDGNPTNRWTNMTLPATLLGLEGDGLLNSTQPIRIRLELGTTIPQLTPTVHALHLGATRVMNPRNLEQSGWTVDSALVVNGTNSNVTNPTLATHYLNSVPLVPTHPISALLVSGVGAGVLITFRDESGAVIHTGGLVNQTVQTTTPFAWYQVEVALMAGGWLHSLKVEGLRGSPAVGASLDVGGDGIVEWQWPGPTPWGPLGWQTQTCWTGYPCYPSWDDSARHAGPGWMENGTSLRHSEMVLEPGSDRGVDHQLQFMMPTGAIPLGATFRIELSSNDTAPEPPSNTTLNLHVGATTLATYDSANPSGWLHLNPTTLSSLNQTQWNVSTNQTERSWTSYSLDVNIVGGLPYYLTASVDTLAIEYLYTEYLDDLGPIVSNLMNTTTPQNGSHEIPIEFGAWQGGVGMWGAVDHAPLMTSEILSSPTMMVPDRPTVITTRHSHLFDDGQITDAYLTLVEPDGRQLPFRLRNPSTNPTFAGGQGAGRVSIDSAASSVVTTAEGFDVTWVLQTEWAWDDVDWLDVKALCSDAAGLNLTGDVVRIGAGSRAVENDMEIDSWEVRNQDGRLLSTRGTPSYPFEVAAGSEVEVSGTLRFEDSPGLRPSNQDFQVSVLLEGAGEPVQTQATSGPDGVWNATVTLPEVSGEVNLTTWIMRAGPLGVSLAGATDVTKDRTPVTLVVDANPPLLGPLTANTPSGPRPADNNIWPQNRLLPISVEVSDAEALGGALFLHYWRQGIDDFDGDGIADPEEYTALREVTPMKATGTLLIDFRAIDLYGNGEGGRVSLFVTGTDLAGHEVVGGGGPGVDSDMATLTTQEDLETTLSLPLIELDRAGVNLLLGVEHTFSFTLIDGNGIGSLDNISVSISGDYPSSDIWLDPLSETMWTNPNSPVFPTGLRITDLGGSAYLVELSFRIGVNAPAEWNTTAQVPAIKVVEHGQKLELASEGLTPHAWTLDQRLEVVLVAAEDLTPPGSGARDGTIYLQPGDRFEFEAALRHLSNGADVTLEGDWEATVSLNDDENRPQTWTVPLDGGHSFTDMVEMVTSRWAGDEANLRVEVLGDGPSHKVTRLDVRLVLDDEAPVIEFPQSTLTTVQSDQMTGQLVTVVVRETGGMGDEPLEMHWSFRRHGVALLDMHGISEIALATRSGDDWMYSSRIDFTVESDVLRPGDELVVWVVGGDLAGHSIVGYGSEGNPRMPLLRVIYFHPVLSDLSVDPDSPMVDEQLLIEGRVTNHGNERGEVKVGLWTWQGSGNGGRWIVLNETVVTLPPQQHHLFAFGVEAWKTGDLQLYIALDDDEANLTSVPVDRVRSLSTTEAFLDSLTSASALGLLLLVLAMLTMGVLLWRRNEEDWFDDDDEFEDGDEDEDEDEDKEGAKDGDADAEKSEDAEADDAEADDAEADDEEAEDAKIDGDDKESTDVPPPPPWAPDEWPDGAGPPPEILTEGRAADEEE
jgi:hypothetical protein